MNGSIQLLFKKLSVKQLSLLITLTLTLLLLFPYSDRPYVVKPKPSQSSTIIEHVFITNHGWHTGIVVPTAIIAAQLPELAERFDNAPFVEIGWGDKGFYQSEEITAELALRAMFWSSGSVIHAVAVPNSPICYFSKSEIVKLGLTQAGLDALTEFIDKSLAMNPQKQLVTLKNGIYGDSQFYEATGRYQLLNTCNKWTAKALASAGVDINTAFKLTANSVINALKEHNNAYIYDKERPDCTEL